MVGFLRKRWEIAKKGAQEQAEYGKNNNQIRATTAVIKTFSKGLGPKLDAVEKAIAANKPVALQAPKAAKDKFEKNFVAIKKLALDAIKLADRYAGEVDKKKTDMGDAGVTLRFALDDIRKRLGDLINYGDERGYARITKQ